jgi:hypothetical protein
MTTLNDTQLVLLTTAARREDNSILPLPETLTSKPAQITKALEALLSKKLVAEADVKAADLGWREAEDRRIGLILTDAGRAAIGLDTKSETAAPRAAPDECPINRPKARSGTKQSLLLDLVQREEGASIDEIVSATGWLAHTARAAITGLRKRGHDVALEKGEGGSRYRCTQATAAK